MANKSTSLVLGLGSQRLSLANVVGASKGALTLTRYETFELEGDPSTDATRVPQMQLGIQDLVNRTKSKGSLVRYAIPGQPVFLRFVNLPPLSEDKVDQIVEFEAQQNVPFPIDEVVWGYQLIGEPGSLDVEVLLGAIKSDELTSINGAVERSGLSSLSVDASPTLIYNAFRYNYSDETEPVLIIDIGARTTNFIYAEPGKVFISNSRIGGASLTQALAKEMNLTFEQAEHMKLEKGAVSLGAGYEPNPDPEVEAMGNILRTALTRLHGEIVRTNNRYRSQQGGQAPAKVLLAGRGSGLPYLAQFFQDKLGVPVEYFNALRNVSVGPKVNQEVVGAEAHAMGDLIGLALRNASGNPIELELVPETLANARDLEKRKPALMLATAALLAGLASGSAYYSNAAKVVKNEAAKLTKDRDGLQLIEDGIRASEKDLKATQADTLPYARTVVDRTYWVKFIEDLNSRLPSNEIWFTGLEPLVDDESITKDIGENGASAFGSRTGIREMLTKTTKGSSKKKGAKAEPVGPMAIDSVRLSGLFRSPATPSMLTDALFSKIKESPYFKLEGDNLEIADYLTNDPGLDDTLWAWPFELTLPLREPLALADLVK